VATPVDGHCHEVLKCAQARKHILCEKASGYDRRRSRGNACCLPPGWGAIGLRLHDAVSVAASKSAAVHSAGDSSANLFMDAPSSPAGIRRWKGGWRQDPSGVVAARSIDMGGHCIDLLEMFFGTIKKVSCLPTGPYTAARQRTAPWQRLFFANARWLRGCLSSVLPMRGARTFSSSTAPTGASWQGARFPRPVLENDGFIAPPEKGTMPSKRRRRAQGVS